MTLSLVCSLLDASILPFSPQSSLLHSLKCVTYDITVLKFSNIFKKWFRFNRISISVLQLNHSNYKNFHQQTTSVLNMLFILDFTRLKCGLSYHKTTVSDLFDVLVFLHVCVLLRVSLFMCLLSYCCVCCC